MEAKSAPVPAPVPPPGGSRNTTRRGSTPSDSTMMAAWVNSPTAD